MTKKTVSRAVLILLCLVLPVREARANDCMDRCNAQYRACVKGVLRKRLREDALRRSLRPQGEQVLEQVLGED